MKEILNMFSKKYVVLLILALSALIIYFDTIDSPFHFDDYQNIIENSDISIKELSYASLKKAAMTSPAGLRPVSYLSFALNYYFAEKNPVPYHIVNLLIHVINGFLIYIIIIALFDDGTLDKESKRALSLSAFFTALIWLVTPLNSQAVIYVVQRMTLLMAMFFLLAFLVYVYGRRRGSCLYFILCGLFFLLSIMSKQNGAIFPLAVITYELTFIKKGNIKGLGKKEAGAIISMSILFILVFLLYRARIAHSINEGYKFLGFTMGERLLTQFRVLIFYITLLVLPLPGRLCVTPNIATSTSIISPVSTLFSIILITALFLVSVMRMKKSPYTSFAILWFFTALSVESTIIPLEMVFEHRMYLPGIFMIGMAVDFIIKKFFVKNKSAVIALFCIVAIAFGTMTVVRGQVWKNGVDFWMDVVNKYPDNARAYDGLGLKLHQEGKYSEAITAYKKALKLDPDNAEMYFDMGNTYYTMGIMKYAEDSYKKALLYSDEGHRVRMTHFDTLTSLADLYIVTKRHKAAEELLRKYSDLYYSKFGEFHYHLSRALNGQKKKRAAKKEYDKAISLGFRPQREY